MQELQKQIDDLKRQIDEMSNKQMSPIIQDVNTFTDIKNITSFVDTVTAAPTHTPQSLYDQIKLYFSGGAYRLYIYDPISKAWKYATLT